MTLTSRIPRRPGPPRSRSPPRRAVLALVMRTARTGRPGPSRPPRRRRPAASTDAADRRAAGRGRADARATPHGYALLADAYLQGVRETGDSGFYGRADGARRAARCERDPRDAPRSPASGTLALARHDFRGAPALRRAPRAALAPASSTALRACSSTRRRARPLRRRPRARCSAWSTVKPTSPLRAGLLLPRAARRPGRRGEAMRLAVVGRRAARERRLRPDAARRPRARAAAASAPRARAYRAGARAASPATCRRQAGLARVDAARAATSAPAIRAAARASVARLPLPEYVVALGETELAAGRARGGAARPRARRRRAAAAARPAASTPTPSWPSSRPTTAAPRAAVALARRAWAAAPSVRSADALGWALTRAGRPARGAALGAPRAAARLARPAVLSTPAWPRARPASAGSRVRRLRARAGAPTRASRRCARRRRAQALEGAAMRRASLLVALRRAARGARGAAAAAHPLGNFSDQPPRREVSRLRATASTSTTSSTRPRSRRSRSAALARGQVLERKRADRVARGCASTVDGRPRRAAPGARRTARASRPAQGGLQHDARRARLSAPVARARASSCATDLPRPRRLAARSSRARARGPPCARASRRRPDRRPAQLPAGAALEPGRRARGDRSTCGPGERAR